MKGPIAIVQARVGSTRLPGKVLADVAGAPLLARMLERLRAAQRLAGIVVATPDGPDDAPVRALAERLGVPTFAGSEHDVLARFAGAARAFDADPIVRLTADCPLIDPEIVDHCIARFLAVDGCDHAGLAGEFPDGLDTEVVSRRALEQAHAEATRPSDREHVTPFVYRQPERFRCIAIRFPVAIGAPRWTVDEPRDLDFVRAVFAGLHRPGHVFGWRDVVRLMAREPALARLNAGIRRNEGYERSLAAEGTGASPAGLNPNGGAS